MGQMRRLNTANSFIRFKMFMNVNHSISTTEHKLMTTNLGKLYITGNGKIQEKFFKFNPSVCIQETQLHLA